MAGTNKIEGMEDLVSAIYAIAHGSMSPGSPPTGLEMLSIAIAGDGFMPRGASVAGSLSEVADSINNLADAIRGLKR